MVMVWWEGRGRDSIIINLMGSITFLEEGDARANERQGNTPALSTHGKHVEEGEETCLAVGGSEGKTRGV